MLLMSPSYPVGEINSRHFRVEVSSWIALGQVISHSLEQIHDFCGCRRFWSAMGTGVITMTESVGYAWATDDRSAGGTKGSGLDENPVFETAESAEEKCNYNSFPNGKDE